MSQITASYFSLLDDFASEVGSSLDDLAVNWDDNQNHVSDGRIRSKTESALSGKNESSADEFGKRLAKPLSFYNPVYTMLHKQDVSFKIKRPTLIPLSQLYGGANLNEAAKNKKDPKAKLKKGLKKGFISKISAAARRRSAGGEKRESNDTPVPENYRTVNKRLSKGSLGNDSEASSTSNLSITQEELPPVINKPTLEFKKLKVPPAKSPRTSKLVDLNDLKKPVDKIEVPTSYFRPEVQCSESSPKKLHSPVITVENEVSTNSNPSSVATTPTRICQSPGFGSAISLSSASEEGLMSDVEVKTMEEVISEVAQEQQNLTSNLKSNMENQSSADFEENPRRLKRNKTLRWTGTRKAPALMKEFTRQHKKVNSEVYSSTEELEMAERIRKQKKIFTPNDSRSCTPSEQTTSFGMEDEYHDAYDDISHDEEVSESHQIDNSGANAATKQENNHKLQKPEAKSPSHRDSAFIVLSSLLPPAPRLRRTQSSKVRAYLQKLGSNKNNALGYAVTQFVKETLKNKEKRPLVLLHDVRSFLSDIKNYFITNPHIGLVKKIERIVSKTSSMDVDGAVDDALDRLVLYPLHSTIYRCLVMNYKDNGQLAVMQEAISLAKRKTTKELGIRKTLIPPDAEAMEEIKNHFLQLQETYSPYFKLKELLAAVTKIYQSTKDLTVEDQSARKLGADDFLPLLVYSLVHCDFVAADIETQYMDGLLDPMLLLGEGGYYLTTLISAIQVVISIQRKEAALPNISDLQGFLKVGISSSEAHPFKKTENKSEEVTLHKTLHVPPSMTAQNLCDMIAKKFNVSAPQNYCLHVVVNDVAHPLERNDCPQLVKMDLLAQFPSTSFYFAFQKRNEENLTSDKENHDTMLVAVDTSGFKLNSPNASPKRNAEFSGVSGTNDDRKFSIGPYLEIESSNDHNKNNDAKAESENQGTINKLNGIKKIADRSSASSDNDITNDVAQIERDVENDKNSPRKDCIKSINTNSQSSTKSRPRSYTNAEETSFLISEESLTAQSSTNFSSHSDAITNEEEKPISFSEANLNDEELSETEVVRLEASQIDLLPAAGINAESENELTRELRSTKSSTSKCERQSSSEKDFIPATHSEGYSSDVCFKSESVEVKQVCKSESAEFAKTTSSQASRLSSDTQKDQRDEVEVLCDSQDMQTENLSVFSEEDEETVASPNQKPYAESVKYASASHLNEELVTEEASDSDKQIQADSTEPDSSPVLCNLSPRNTWRSNAFKNRSRTGSSLSARSSPLQSPSHRVTFDAFDLPTASVSCDVTPKNSRRFNAIKRRSGRQSSLSSESSLHDSSFLDTQFKRKSCMLRESVASLTEFFESKTNEQSETLRKPLKSTS